MFDRGAITVKFKAELKEFKSGLREAIGDVRKFASVAGREIKNVAAKVADLTKALGIGLVGAFTAVSAYGLKMGNSIQQTAIAFDTMLGDADKRRKLMAEITDFAKNTPFERFELIDASKLLLAMGVGADKVIPSMQMLGDISAGVSANVKDVAFVFGQVRAQGQAYTPDLNQFASRGIPVYEELAKVLGITVAELRDGMGSNQIKVTFAELNTAFQNLTKEGGKFNGLMERQSKSLGGILSNLKDGLDNMILTFMGITAEGDVKTGSFFDLATKKAEGFQNWLAANEETIGRWGERTFGMIAEGIDIAWNQGIAPLLREFRDWFNTGGKEAIKGFLSEAWQGMKDAFVVFKNDILPELLPRLQAFGEYLKSEEFKSAIVATGTIIGDVVEQIARLVDTIQEAIDKFYDLKHTFEQTQIKPLDKAITQSGPWALLQGRFRFGGQRAMGGHVKASGMYEVGEYNRPELLKVGNKQYMIPGNRGQVMNQEQITNNNQRNITITQYGASLDEVFTSAPFLAV